MQERYEALQDRFRQAAVATGRAEPGVIDHARNYATEAGERVYVWVNERSPWMGARLDDAAAAASDLDRKGYGRHFKEFNASLLRPLKEGTSEVVRVVKATAVCAPGQNVTAAFTLWNVLCFWLNVLLLVIDLLLT